MIIIGKHCLVTHSSSSNTMTRLFEGVSFFVLPCFQCLGDDAQKLKEFVQIWVKNMDAWPKPLNIKTVLKGTRQTLRYKFPIRCIFFS